MLLFVPMHDLAGHDPFKGVFIKTVGAPRLERHPEAAKTLPDPKTGRPLRIATVELSGAICPSCDARGEGGFISFVEDLRLVFACPNCRSLTWIAGA